MNTLITGGNGLLGKSIQIESALKPTRNELDLFDYESLSKYVDNNNITSIIHCAAKVGGVKANTDKMFDFFFENSLINLNILRVCKEKNIKKIIFIISTCVFPSNAKLPFSENSLHQGEPHNSNFGYAYAKRMLEVGFRSLKKQYDIDSTCLIPCNLYGENDNYNVEDGHVIPSLIHKCYLSKINNTDFEVWGSGKSEREFMYVKDFSNIIQKIHNENMHIDTPLIVSPDRCYSILEAVGVIVDKIGFKGNVVFDHTKPEGILKKNTDSRKFKEYFPNFEFTDLGTGLEETIDFFLENYSTIKK